VDAPAIGVDAIDVGEGTPAKAVVPPDAVAGTPPDPDSNMFNIPVDKTDIAEDAPDIPVDAPAVPTDGSMKCHKTRQISLEDSPDSPVAAPYTVVDASDHATGILHVGEFPVQGVHVGELSVQGVHVREFPLQGAVVVVEEQSGDVELVHPWQLQLEVEVNHLLWQEI
jgi:hypothetical protein